jgi:CheY-like chemotaxis protein
MTLKLLEPKIRQTRLFAGEREVQLEDTPAEQADDVGMTLQDQPVQARKRSCRKTLLLVSDDAGLDAVLGGMNSTGDLACQRVSDSAVAFCLATQDQPSMVFVDLDLPAMEGWEIAERFLKDVHGPPLLLLSGRPTHFDMEMAIRTGMVLDKSVPPVQWLEKMSRLLTESKADQEHDRAGQRLLLRLLHPFDWIAPGAPVNRHWGINE